MYSTNYQKWEKFGNGVKKKFILHFYLMKMNFFTLLEGCQRMENFDSFTKFNPLCKLFGQICSDQSNFFKPMKPTFTWTMLEY